jgi:Bacterial Ig-like domain (group 3)
VLTAGNAQTLSVSFTPTNTANYNTASKNVLINVMKATPTIAWNNPADITVGTALSATQLNATASVPGSFAYTPSSGTVLSAGNGQTLHVDFTPTDAANYNTASKNVLINVTNQSQATTTTSTPTSSLNPSTVGQSVTLSATVTPSAATGLVEFFDGTVSLGTASLSGGSASLATTAINAGTRSITAKYVGSGSFTSSTSSVLTQTVNPAGGTASVAVSALTPQYSDMETFTATFTPTTGGPVPARMTFKVGTQIVGDAPVTLVGGVFQAQWTGQLLEPTPPPGTGQMKPGSRAVTAVADSNFNVTSPAKLITIQKEDARVTNTTPTSISFGGSATGTVVLSANVRDITAVTGDAAWDNFGGDIRNATVSFVDRSTAAIIATVNVALSGSDPKVGVATFNWPVNLGTATSQTISIGFIVSNYYNRNSTLDNVNITVNK